MEFDKPNHNLILWQPKSNWFWLPQNQIVAYFDPVHVGSKPHMETFADA